MPRFRESADETVPETPRKFTAAISLKAEGDDDDDNLCHFGMLLCLGVAGVDCTEL